MASNGADEPSGALQDCKISDLDGKAPDSTDFANYFCTYGYIYHQKDMLEDHKRTGAYHHAILHNRRAFAGKVVLDVGTGSGILALFAAQAGAKKVYAVEATNMARMAKLLVEANGYSGTIEVIQGTVETVALPEKVDIIISEWMGYFLMRESMLDCVLAARDRFLKPGGALFPSQARMLMAPIRTGNVERNAGELGRLLSEWRDFVADVHSFYDVDLSPLSAAYEEEQREYLLQTATWTDVHPGNLLGSTAVVADFDLASVPASEAAAPLRGAAEMVVTRAGPISGLAGFFDVAFRGSQAMPLDQEVVLSTAPDVSGATHWGQLTFQLHPPLNAAPGDTLKVKFELQRQKENSRLLLLKLNVNLEGPSPYARREPSRECFYRID